MAAQKKVELPTLRRTHGLEESMRPRGQKRRTNSNERTRSRQTAPGLELKTVGTAQPTTETWTRHVKKA